MANYYVTVTNIFYVTGVETEGEARSLVEDYEDSDWAPHPQVTFKDQVVTEEKDTI
jgi:hypothetical protein